MEDNSAPKFSIIMPTYNRANLLPRAVASVLSQTYQNFELIIINDGSPDNTEEVIKSFTDKRIVKLKHEKNRGVYAGINTGLDSVKGEFITLLGDDDELYPDALENVFSKINEYHPKGFKVFWFDSFEVDLKKVNSDRKDEGIISYKDLLCDNIKIDPCFFVDANLFRQKRIEEKTWKDSGTMWLDFYKENFKYLPLYVPKAICKTRLMQGSHLSHPEASLGNVLGVIFAQKFFLSTYGKELKKLCPNRCGERMAMLGFYQIMHGEKTDGRKNILESFKYKFSIKYGILFILSYILNGHQVGFVYTKILKLRAAVYSLFIFLKKNIKINV
jgi:glycosyltransferase involved in cell wall biosynthesis